MGFLETLKSVGKRHTCTKEGYSLGGNARRQSRDSGKAEVTEDKVNKGSVAGTGYK